MAIGRISGQVLKSNLYREDVDISFSNFPGDVPLLYFNISNNFLGVNTDTPTNQLEVNGTTKTTNLISDAVANLGDIEIQNNSIASTLGDLNLRAATVGDTVVINSNTNITENLTVDNDTFTNSFNVANGITIAEQGVISPGSEFALAEDGDIILQSNSVDFIVRPDDTNRFGVEGDMVVAGSLKLDSSNLTFENSLGDTVLTVDGETGAITTTGTVDVEELIVNDIRIDDNFVEVTTQDVNLILRSGPKSFTTTFSNIILESETEALEPLKLNSNSKLIVQNELEIDGNTIESYASDINFIVNNLADSTVNTFNFFGNTNNYGSVFVEDDLDVGDTITSPTSVFDTITTNTGNLDIDVSATGLVNIRNNLNVIDTVFADQVRVNNVVIDNNAITTTAGNDLSLSPTTNLVVVNNTLEAPNLISTALISGDNIISRTGDINIQALTPTNYINLNSNVEVQGNLHATGSITADGDLVLGDEDTDNIVFNADINSNILPDINSDGTTGYTIGFINKNWKNIFTKKLTVDGYTIDAIDNNENNLRDNPSDTALATQGAISRFIDEVNTGNEIPLGPPEDSSYADGAFIRSASVDSDGDPKPIDAFNFDISVAQAIDLLNESLNNVRNNTFIRSVDYSASPQAAGSGSTITLNLDVDGNHNQVEVDWDVTGQLVAQGVFDNKEITYPSGTDTVSFTYNAPLGGLFTVKVVVRNTDSDFPGSAGTDAEEEKVDFIIIYTPDPVADFDLYRSLTGGTALSGNLLYVIEGQALALENETSNTGISLGAGNTATYTINWGDGTAIDNIASDTDPGGRDGARISHTFADGTSTGTGSTNVTLTLTSHSTADPAVIPVSANKTIKIYENDPATPDFIDTKTLTFGSNGSQGDSPRLASGFTDNSAVTTLQKGDPINRTTRTSGNIVSNTISTLSYGSIGLESDFDPLNPPVVTSLVNNSAEGSITLTNIIGGNTGTNDTLILSSEEDYNLFNSSGQSVSFANSVFYPDAFGGFRARVEKSATTVSVGANTYQIQHTTPSGTYTSGALEFVKDDITAAPNVVDGTLSENQSGVYRYISGIPYYDAGTPSLRLSGLGIENLVGQAYVNRTDILQVRSSLNYEGTGSPAIQSQDFSYTQLNNGINPFLDVNIPIANTGVGSPYTVTTLVIPITTLITRTIDTVRWRARNVNGFGAYGGSPLKIAVHKAEQSGISEIAIAVDNSLGNGVFTDDGIRIFNFANDPVSNPVFSSTGVNYYTNNPYSESNDPGVEGTQEATIRIGVLEHNTENYSTGFLPVGPDRTGDTGTQYFTFAFRRQVVANFGIRIVSGSGVAGVWIAAPGTAIDTASSINGWLDCSIQYAGAGVPGGDSDNGGNGSNGCAITGSDIINTNSSLNGQFNMTLGAENMSNATNNVVLVRIALDAGQEITTLEIKEA